jgi:hypothetical protein
MPPSHDAFRAEALLLQTPASAEDPPPADLHFLICRKACSPGDLADYAHELDPAVLWKIEDNLAERLRRTPQTERHGATYLRMRVLKHVISARLTFEVLGVPQDEDAVL